MYGIERDWIPSAVTFWSLEVSASCRSCDYERRETKRPESLAIFTEVREVINALSERLGIPAQNIINTEYARRLCWEPPEPYSQDALAAALYECGARRWQVQLLAPQMHQIFVAHLEK